MWIKNPQVKKYPLIRELVMNIGTLTEILGLYVAFLLGADKWGIGLTVLAFCVVVNNLLSRGWLWLIKH
jgi:hypothetical protein